MRKFFVLICILIVLVFNSCTPVPESEADEIRFNRWSKKFKNGSRATLSFEGDRAGFKVDSADKDACLSLSGLCVFDSEKFALYDESDGGEYVFRYKLCENKLTLYYDEGKITLKRQ